MKSNKMSDTAEPKKARKCGNCGKEGHDKRKCPKVEIPPETKAEPQTIYALICKEDNGDSISEYVSLYASIDGLVKGIEKTIVSTRTDLDQDDDDPPDTTKVPREYKDLFYYTEDETLKNAPIPTKEYVESVLNAGSKRSHLNGLILKIGETMGGAAGFGFELAVQKKTVNP
jgi:hypothetical protein